MIADDIWDMILGKAGKLPGEVAPELKEKAKAEGRVFLTNSPQENYPDQLDHFRELMQEKGWATGEDDEDLFEYAMHPAQYEAFRSGKAKADFLADVEKRRNAKAAPKAGEQQPTELTVTVDGKQYSVKVAYGDEAAQSAQLAQLAPSGSSAPAGEGEDVTAPLEGKFYRVKNSQETPKNVGDKVKKGDVLFYIEAMKTYNAILADFDGTITAFNFAAGDSVEEDDVVMKIAKA